MGVKQPPFVYRTVFKYHSQELSKIFIIHVKHKNNVKLSEISEAKQTVALITVLNTMSLNSSAMHSVWAMCGLTQEQMAKDGDVNSGC